jgi:CheY-like chemotaxis protein
MKPFRTACGCSVYQEALESHRDLPTGGRQSDPITDYISAMNTMIMQPEAVADARSAFHTILVVEDEIMVRMPISEYLRDCGYTVLEAADASEAIAILSEADGSVHVVFSDVRMPGKMDGFGLAQWLRKQHPEISVILTSGYTGVRCLPDSLPGVRFIEKPYSQGQVAKRIAALLTSD